MVEKVIAPLYIFIVIRRLKFICQCHPRKLAIFKEVPGPRFPCSLLPPLFIDSALKWLYCKPMIKQGSQQLFSSKGGLQVTMQWRHEGDWTKLTKSSSRLVSSIYLFQALTLLKATDIKASTRTLCEEIVCDIPKISEDKHLAQS